MCTLQKGTAIAVLFLLLLINTKLFSQDMPEYELDKVVVTSGRFPVTFSELARNIIVITEKDISQLPVSSIQDLLQYYSGVDLKQRGVKSTQADVIIRGGTFEQTLVMIDGVKISDPQTAHHNLNLPVSLDQIERIEILKGQGSRIFGPNAFSGAINFITKKSSDNNLTLNISGGSYSSYDMSVTGSISTGSLANHLSISKQKADGYITNTNYNLQNISYNSSYTFGAGAINLLAGYSDHKFGANSFYTTRYPNQWEQVKTKIIALSGEIGNNIFLISPKLYWRIKNDEFLLDHTNPEYYRNLHETDSYGMELQATLFSNWGTTSFGGEITEDKIESTNLGNHERSNKGIFVEHQFSPFNNIFISAGGYLYNYAGIGWKFWPGIDASYQVTDAVKVFGSYGKAFRIPSYTDLYYSDQVTMGNKNLRSEETTNYEFGLNYFTSTLRANFSLFRREGSNIIDWIKNNNEEQWHADNITKVNITGFEFSTVLNLSKLLSTDFLQQISVSYTYLNSDKTASGYDSRYALDFLTHQLISSMQIKYFGFVNHSVNVRYEERKNFEDNLLVDTRVSAELYKGELYFNAANIFDKIYHDISGVVLPGRWLTIGYKMNIF